VDWNNVTNIDAARSTRDRRNGNEYSESPAQAILAPARKDRWGWKTPGTQSLMESY